MTTSTSILYTSYDGMTDALGQSQVLPYLSGLARKHAFNFHLISCEKPQRFLESKEKIETLTREVGIEWHPIPYTKKPPILSTVFDLVRMYFLAKKIVLKYNIKMVHSRSIVSAIVGYKIAKKYGLKFIYDMRGFYADERVDGNLWNLKNPVYRFIYNYIKKWETKCINESDCAICLTHAGKSELYKWKNIRADAKIEVIPCCADLNLFNPDSLNANDVLALRDELKIESHQPVLTYLGSLGTWYMLDEMLVFFKSFLKEFPNAVFLFINKGDENYIRERATAFGILDKVKIRAATREEVVVLLSLSNYSIFFIKPSYSKIASSPTKQGEIMAMGIPVICNDKVGDTAEIIKRYQAGLVVSNISKENFDAEVQTLKNSTYSIKNIMQGAQEVFALENGVDYYYNLYSKVLS